MLSAAVSSAHAGTSAAACRSHQAAKPHWPPWNSGHLGCQLYPSGQDPRAGLQRAGPVAKLLGVQQRPFGLDLRLLLLLSGFPFALLPCPAASTALSIRRLDGTQSWTTWHKVLQGMLCWTTLANAADFPFCIFATMHIAAGCTGTSMQCATERYALAKGGASYI